MELNEIRQEIDKIDDKIIGLLSKRAELVTKAGKLKRDEQGVRDPKRVEQVINKVKTRATEAGLDPYIAEQIYRTIIGCFVAKELKDFSGGDAQPLFFSNSHLPTKKILDGIALKTVSGDKTMMTFFEFEPNAIIPSHKHPHEQITYIIEGAIEFTVNEETKVLKAGDGVVIPSNQEHSAKILDKSTMAVDAQYPIREDYL